MVITTKEMYSEVHSILKILGKEYMEKLPKTILKIIIESREENYNPKYDLSIPLKNQDINRKSIAMITLLHYNYWCETQEEKSKLKKMLEENEEKYQKEIKEKYSNDKIFNNKNIENKIEEKQGRIIGVQRKLKISEIEEKVEAIIFLAKEMVTVQELAQFYAMENFEMEEVLHSLREKRKNTGINLKIENGGVFLVSNPLFGFDVKRFFNPEMKLKKLSRSAMETLAIIAYKGPVTKAEIEQIRGAGADKTMANLLERKLIYISGKKKSIGTPNLYEVTEDFYSYLNIHGREELPGSEQFQKIDLLYREDEKMETESSDNENV